MAQEETLLNFKETWKIHLFTVVLLCLFKTFLNIQQLLLFINNVLFTKILYCGKPWWIIGIFQQNWIQDRRTRLFYPKIKYKLCICCQINKATFCIDFEYINKIRKNWMNGRNKKGTFFPYICCNKHFDYNQI